MYQFKAWTEFCALYRIDKDTFHLQHEDDQDEIFKMFAAASSMGYGNRKPVSAETFCSVRMSAVKSYYKEKFYHKFSKGIRLDMGMEGYKRLYSSNSPQRLPFGPLLMRVLGTELLGEGTPQAFIQWGCALLGFFSLCRAGETWGPIKPEKDADHLLKWNNISFGYGSWTQRKADDKTEWVDVYFASSKGDRYKKGVTVRLGKNIDTLLCPVKAIRWIQKGRRHLKLRNLPDSRISEIQKGVVIHRQTIINRLKRIAQAHGMDPARVSGHSVRIGAATQLMASGFDDTIIKLMGRWNSDCYMQYLRLNPKLAGKVAMRILDM